MKTLETRDYRITFPDDWDCQRSPNTVAIFKIEEGKGALNISVLTLGSAEDVIPVRLVEVMSGGPEDIVSLEDGQLKRAYKAVSRNGKHWRYWVISKASTAIVTTYNCRQSFVGWEDAEVDDIVSTIEIETHGQATT